MPFNPNLSFEQLITALLTFKGDTRQVRSAELPPPGVPQPLITPGNSIGVDGAGSAKDVAILAASAFLKVPSSPSTPFSANRRIFLTTNADDQYGGNLQTAIDAAVALVPPPSFESPVIVDILSPGTYTGNFVVPVSHVYLFAGGAGNSPNTRLTSSSMNTLSVPDANSGAQGLTVESTSVSSLDTALVIQSTGSGTHESVFFGCLITAPNGAAAIRSLVGGFNLIALFFCCFIDGVTPILVECLGAGLAFIASALTNEPGGTVARATNGSAVIFVNTYCANDPAGSGWIADADGAVIAMLNVQGLNAANWARGTNGSVLFLPNSASLDVTGTRLFLDATSTCFLGNMTFDFFTGNPYAGFIVAVPGNVLFMETLDFAVGTTAGPDTRPTTPKPGMGFYATDLIPPRIINFVPGVGWIDGAGTLIP